MPSLESADVEILRRLTGIALGRLAPTTPMSTDDVAAALPNMALEDVAARLSGLEAAGYAKRYRSVDEEGWVLTGRGIAAREVH